MRKGIPGVPVIVAPAHVNGTTIVREMARKGAYVVAVGTSPDTPGLHSRFARERIVLEPPDAKPGNFVSFLLSRKDLYGGIVVPTDDFYVRELAQNYEALSPHYRLAVSPNPATDIALDKSRTYEVCGQIGIPIPRTVPLESDADLEQAAQTVVLPAILRPAFSIAFYRDFAVKSFIVSTAAEIREKLVPARAKGHRMLLQEIVRGPAEKLVSCKAYVTNDGDVVGALAAYKLASYPPRLGVSQMQESHPGRQFVDGMKRILGAIGFRGSLAGSEWKFDERDSTWKLLEVNARSVLAIRLMKFCGCDVIDMLWRDKLGLPQLPPPRPKHYRRWAYIKNGLLLYRKHPEERKSLGEYLRLYRPPICFALFDPFDIRPFVKDIAPLVKRRLGGGEREP